MHEAGRRWLQRCNDVYPQYFKTPCRVLELGSFNVNGTVRDYFHAECDHVGVDWRPGPCVDVVSLAHNLGDLDDPRFRVPFDVLISDYTFEHDPYWELSLRTGISFLKEEAPVFLSWGAARCRQHRLSVAPDGNFHALPAGRVLLALAELGFVIHEFWYEANMPGIRATDCAPGGGWGEVAVVAARTLSPIFETNKGHLDALLPEDNV